MDARDPVLELEFIMGDTDRLAEIDRTGQMISHIYDKSSVHS
jgi:hypothetical protein